MITGLVLEDQQQFDLLSHKTNIFLLQNQNFHDEIVEKSILCLNLSQFELECKLGRYNSIDLSSVTIDEISHLVNKIIHLSSRIPNLSVLLPGNCFEIWNFWNQNLKPHVDVAIYIERGSVDNWTVESIQYILLSKHSYQLKIENTENRLKSAINQYGSMDNDLNSIFARFNAPIIASQLNQLNHIKSLMRRNSPGLYNFLIDPLQPLTSNLTLDIYTQFERDETKYEQYKFAMELAIHDLPGRNLTILIVGPGKGKLIDKLLSISLHNIELIAIEINPKVIDSLNLKNSTAWNNKVHIIHDDIRTCKLSFKPDIIISELLGSFGDNELCPEILSRFNDDPIMIPSSYASYLQPIYTSVELPKPMRPYLSYLTSYYQLDDFKFVWKFNHPTIDSTNRYSKIQFICRKHLKLNGFYGYFQANLYGHINIHTNPHGNQGEYCKSWYPILFPVEEYETKWDNEVLELQIFRKVDNKVWYEWIFKDKVYNLDGSDYSMSL